MCASGPCHSSVSAKPDMRPPVGLCTVIACTCALFRVARKGCVVPIGNQDTSIRLHGDVFFSLNHGAYATFSPTDVIATV